jgi:DNA-binding transcriptional regulator YhcF (GntR family)
MKPADATTVLDFEPQSNLPLNQQVASYIRQKIQSGSLPQGATLPASNSFEGVSHVTVLKAYQQLEKEGLIEIRRSRGSRVIAPVPVQQYVLITMNADHHATLYENQIMASAYDIARFEDQPARVIYLPTKRIEDKEQAGVFLTHALEPLLGANLVRGVIVNHPGTMPGVLDWLSHWKLPVVGLGNMAVNHVCLDHRQAGIKAVEYLKAQGCRKIQIQYPPEYLKHARHIAKLHPDVDAITYPNHAKTPGMIQFGRELAKELQQSPVKKRPDALVLFDDMLMLGLRIELAELGMKVPQSIRLLLCSHQSQILDAFENIDLLFFETDEVIRMAVDAIESMISTRKEPQKRLVDFQFKQQIKA